MTKYILHGGMAGVQTPDNKLYYREMLKDLRNPSVLLVYFAREPNEYEHLEERDFANFRWANPDQEIKLTLATEQNFIEQVENSNVIYICGGVTSRLLTVVNKLKIDAAKLCENKVVSGSSAGAHLISRWYYGHKDGAVGHGLGLLPVTVFTHYRPAEGSEFWKSDEDVEAIEVELRKKSGSNEIIFLPEQKFKTYTV
jgi:hypothetical protein